MPLRLAADIYPSQSCTLSSIPSAYSPTFYSVSLPACWSEDGKSLSVLEQCVTSSLII